MKYASPSLRANSQSLANILSEGKSEFAIPEGTLVSGSKFATQALLLRLTLPARLQLAASHGKLNETAAMFAARAVEMLQPVAKWAQEQDHRLSLKEIRAEAETILMSQIPPANAQDKEGKLSLEVYRMTFNEVLKRNFADTAKMQDWQPGQKKHKR